MQEQQQQQQQQVQGAPADPERELAPQAPRRPAGDDDTWGLGSATALESLRRRNFRGRRSSASDDERPSSE